jgi:hypothetical protein
MQPLVTWLPLVTWALMLPWMLPLLKLAQKLLLLPWAEPRDNENI